MLFRSDQNLTTVQVSQVHTYLAKKWGLKSSVDSDDDGIADATDATPAGLIAQPKSASLEIAFADQAGNTGATVTRTDSGATVGIDTSAPVLTTVSVASNNPGNTSLAKAGETVTMTVQSSEPLTALTLSKPDGSDPKTMNPVDTAGTQWTLSRPVVAEIGRAHV